MSGTGSLEDRTRQLIKEFDEQEKGYAFNYAGDGTVYAVRFAGLLREWLARAGDGLTETVPDLEG